MARAVDGEPVRIAELELPRPGPFRAELPNEGAAFAELLDAVVARVGHEHVSVGSDGDPVGPLELAVARAFGAKLAEVFAFFVELLHAVVVPVDYPYVSVGDGDPLGFAELARFGAGGAHRFQEVAFGVEHLQTSGVGVRDPDVAVRIERDAFRRFELSGLGAGRADRADAAALPLVGVGERRQAVPAARVDGERLARERCPRDRRRDRVDGELGGGVVRRYPARGQRRGVERDVAHLALEVRVAGQERPAEEVARDGAERRGVERGACRLADLLPVHVQRERA